MASREDVFREVEQKFGQVPTWFKALPEEGLEGFWSTMRDFHLGETRIPNKYKELIGIAVSGATRCRYCTLFHTEAARLFGATDEEIAEASLMAAHTMNGSTYLNAMQTDYTTFKEETLAMVAFVREQQPRSSKKEQKTQGKSPGLHA